MRLFVTGGSGFVGSNFIRYILQHYGPEWVTNVDDLRTGRLVNLEGIAGNYGERYEFLHADVADPDRMDALFEKHQFFAVVHFAAEASGAAGTAALLERARRHGVRRFLLVSREGVETMKPVEAAVLAAHREYGQEVVITRTTDCYGPFQPPGAFIPAVILRALADQPVPLGGDGLHVRDWLHVEDYSAAAFTSLLDGTPGTVYYFASAFKMRDIDLVQRILEQLGKGRDLIRFVPGSEALAAAPAPMSIPGEGTAVAGHQRSIPQWEQEVAWKPRHEFDRGLRETIDWYVRNREWWETLPRG
jgi:dTDP-glucose 4,6-dehydratase